ncbi:hypothetical protein [Streptomyces sp. G7(2002)]|uniref:hypothetical protein n=1 Tax=Streptomyces sp. G7(2002) TaxID=2971798 RepID=UPI00237D339A|nr:hypothetical protein [Streptomyces sp. G7(2002)]WDT52599.1 hypothetical protein NUT86_00265 [Streptomyces sp. G7(2002)]
MRNKLRVAAATVTAAVALGAAAPMASAAEANRAPAVSSVQTTANSAAAHGSSIETLRSAAASTVAVATIDAKSGVQAKKKIGGVAGQIASRIFAKYGKSAAKKIAKTWKSYRKWVNGLSNWNPLKWLIKAAGHEIQYQIYLALRGMAY